jgi:diguanylate cyclase (GGDEF)-like protein
MFKHVTPEVSRIIREQGKASLAILDIDHFKNINDTYGHQKGDEILKRVAASLNSDKRDYDFLARFGGEEFLLWLPNADVEIAKIVCNRIRLNVEKLTQCETPISISIGISCYIDGDFKNLGDKKGKLNQLILDELILEADKALYEAKDSGRNCVKAYSRNTGN